MFRRVAVLILLVIGAGVLYGVYAVLRPPAEASAPIEAVPLAVDSAEDAPATVAAVEPATVPAVEVSESSPAVAPATEAPTEDSSEATAAGPTLFQITPAASQVRFELDEDLRGQRTTVVGVTDQVAGEIALDLVDLTTAQVGAIQVNARTLATDNDFRNRAIQNRILDTGQYEFITFSPTAIEGLPATAAVGEMVAFSLVGQLTIRDISQEVVFSVEATPLSDAQLSGTASTVISRADYDLVIPSVRDVANVEEEVELYIDFIANRA